MLTLSLSDAAKPPIPVSSSALKTEPTQADTSAENVSGFPFGKSVTIGIYYATYIISLTLGSFLLLLDYLSRSNACVYCSFTNCQRIRINIRKTNQCRYSLRYSLRCQNLCTLVLMRKVEQREMLRIRKSLIC